MKLIPGLSEPVHPPSLPVHGSLDFRELQSLGLRPEDILDFSANVNPAGPSPHVRQAIAGVPLEQYPDRECLELRAALSAFLGVPPERILPGNGVSELIWLVALGFVAPGSRVQILGPTFSEYARATECQGASVEIWQARAEAGFVPDVGEISDRLKSVRPHLVFLCNPNNPTGTVLPPEVIAAWTRQHSDTLFVVDEAYLPFTTLESVLLLAATRSGYCGSGRQCPWGCHGLAPWRLTLVATQRRA